MNSPLTVKLINCTMTIIKIHLSLVHSEDPIVAIFCESIDIAYADY